MGAAAPDPPLTARTDRLAAVLGWVERESLLVLVSVLYVAALLVRLPHTLAADSWLTLVAGRELREHGLPDVDALAVWSRGEAWVDQQWLAQVVFDAVARAGELKLALLLHAALLVGAFLFAVVAGHRLGGSSRATALVAVLAVPQLAQQWQLRAQSFAYLLFVAVVALLVADVRAGGRRVLLCLPVLALWGNLHGSVLVGAGLVVLRGLLLLRGPRRATGACLVLLAPLALLLSPYAGALPGYYAGMLFGHDFSALVVEWGPATPGLMTAPFYVLAFGTVWLLGRSRGAGAFERLALLLLLVGGMLAVRNMVWLSLAAIVVLPRILTPSLPADRDEAGRLVKVGLPLFGAAVAAAVALVVVSRPADWYDRADDAPVAAAVAAASERHPDLSLLAGLEHADRLLWREPQLRGRLQFDARLELLSPDELRALYEWENRIGDWERIPGCRALVLVERGDRERALLRLPRTQREWRGGNVALLRLERTSC